MIRKAILAPDANSGHSYLQVLYVSFADSMNASQGMVPARRLETR
jgi:hypothetical protein